jgi:Opacity family porin protein
MFDTIRHKAIIMKKHAIALLTCMVLFSSAALAQFMIGGQASYLASAESGKKNQWGFGLQAKGKIDNHFAIGGIAKTYLKNYSEYESPSLTVRAADATTQLGAMFEYYFAEKVQPYIGTDVGVYFTNTIVERNSASEGNIETKNDKTYFGVGPKAGVLFNSQGITPFVQAQYHVLFGGGEDIEIPGFTDVIRTQDRFWTFDIGILFPIGKTAKE